MVIVMRRNKPIFLRVLVLILALLVLIMCPLNVFGEAHAVVTEAALAVEGIIYVVGTILVASGVVFASQEDVQNAARHIYTTYIAPNLELVAELTKIVDGSRPLISKAGAVVHLSKRLWDAVVGSHWAELTQTGSLGNGWSNSVTVPYGAAATDCFGLIEQFNTHDYHSMRVNGDIYSISINADNRIQLYKNSVKQFTTVYYYGNRYRFSLEVYGTSQKYFSFSIIALTSGSDPRWIGDGFLNNSSHPIDFTISYPLGIPFSGSIALPAPDTLVRVPDLPKEGTDGKVLFPSIPLVPKDAVIKDLPDVVLPGAGIQDLPYDVVIDVSTGAVVGDGTVPDVDVPTTEVGWLAKLADMIGSIGATISGAFDIPTASDAVDGLKLPQVWVKKFPFCIPFDVARLFSQINVDPIKPVFVVPVKYSTIVNETVTLDLTRFETLFGAIKWLIYAGFVLGLARATREFIKW